MAVSISEYALYAQVMQTGVQQLDFQKMIIPMWGKYE
jgi:hypothetical protein